MRNENDALFILLFFQRFQYDSFVDTVDVTCRLVQKDKFAASEERPRQAYALFFARGEVIPERDDLRLVPVGQSHYKIVYRRHFTCVFDFFLRCVGFRDTKVVFYRLFK